MRLAQTRLNPRQCSRASWTQTEPSATRDVSTSRERSERRAPAAHARRLRSQLRAARAARVQRRAVRDETRAQRAAPPDAARDARATRSRASGAA